MGFITQIMNGLSTGGMYALVAIGYTMVYGIAKMINFAHGEFIMVGAYIAYVFTTMLKMPIFVSVIASIIGCALLGVITEKVAYKPLRGSGSLSVLITAIGVSYLLQNLFLILFGSAARTFPTYMKSGTLNIFGIRITYISLLSLCLTLVCTGILLFFINKTRLGKQCVLLVKIEELQN